MNITLTITGGTAAEIQQAVQDLSNSFAVGEKGELIEAPVKKEKVSKKVLPVPGPEVKPETVTPPEPEPEISAEITIEDIRAAANKVAESGKRKEVKDLITSFGAKNLSALDKQYFGDFMLKLKTL